MGLRILPHFTWNEFLFSLKTFVSAMLAMYIANRSGLERPFWALMTAYIVANSSAGAVRSKAVFRFLGTCIGSAAALYIIPHFSNAPVFMTMVMSCWVGGCLYISLLDRTPRSYIFMLAAYTTAFIGFPNVDKPELMFDNAIARVEEIGLAIACSAVIHSIFLPKSMTQSVLGLIDRTVVDFHQWFANMVQPGNAVSQTAAMDRQRIAGDITQLRLLSTHIPYDTTNLKWTAEAVYQMQERMALLMPHLSALEDRIKAYYCTYSDLPADLHQMLNHVQTWAATLPTMPPDQVAVQYQQLMDQLQLMTHQITEEQSDEKSSWWQQALKIGLIQRLRESASDWFMSIQLRKDIDKTLHGAAVPFKASWFVWRGGMHLDRGMAALSALTTAVVVSVCCLFWMVTGWNFGYVVAMMAAVSCCFYATMDDPTRAMYGFMKWTLWSIPISAIYVLVLLPLVHDFGMLVLICAPYFLFVGCLMAKPAYFGPGMGLMFGVAMTLALHDTRSADLVSYLNFMVAEIIGIIFTALITKLIRSVQADWQARRIQKAIWRELGDIANQSFLPKNASYAVRMLDRMAMILPRIAQSSDDIKQKMSFMMMVDMRIGSDLVTLRNTSISVKICNFMPLFLAISHYYRCRHADEYPAPSQTISVMIDTHIQQLLRQLSTKNSSVKESEEACQQAITALVGLRRNLFAEAMVPQSALATQP